MFIDYLNPYAYLMCVRRAAYCRGWLRSYSAGIPTIGVGNLSVGGTGKSPMVLLIAEYLEKKAKRVAIVSRGYKRRTKGLVVVSNGNDILCSVEESGDEPQMFAQMLPNAIVIVDEFRVRGAIEAKKLGGEIIILDDGFQHLRLKRDLNILLTNGTVSPVLPFGRSREPESAAIDADIIVLCDLKEHSDPNDVPKVEWRSVPSYLESIGGPSVPLSTVEGKPVLAVSSIARPERFHAMLNALGATITPFILPDHAEYSIDVVNNILKSAEKARSEFIVTTAKDMVKSRAFLKENRSSVPMLILHHKLEFLRGERSFYDAIDKIL